MFKSLALRRPVGLISLMLGLSFGLWGCAWLGGNAQFGDYRLYQGDIVKGVRSAEGVLRSPDLICYHSQCYPMLNQEFLPLALQRAYGVREVGFSALARSPQLQPVSDYLPLPLDLGRELYNRQREKPESSLWRLHHF